MNARACMSQRTDGPGFLIVADDVVCCRIMIEMGSSHASISDRASSPKGGFHLKDQKNYQLDISSMTLDVHSGNGLPGFYDYHNGREFTTHDGDHDASGSSNCANNYNSAPWWYGGCWSGSIWGGCGNSHTKGPYWTGSGGVQRNHAGIYVQF